MLSQEKLMELWLLLLWIDVRKVHLRMKDGDTVAVAVGVGVGVGREGER